jgi:hypothetical protein
MTFASWWWLKRRVAMALVTLAIQRPLSSEIASATVSATGSVMK